LLMAIGRVHGSFQLWLARSQRTAIQVSAWAQQRG
jgi:hypothetical protein